MVNKEVAAQFNLLAALMELHGENAFKTKSYLSTYQSLRKWDRPLTEMSEAEIVAIPGISASAASKIRELITTGLLPQLEKLKQKTPEGIQQLLQIKGMGPKKIRTIWDSLGIETPAELLYACTENRLVRLPGFGLKTQEDLCAKISYYLDSQHRYLYGVIENDLKQFEASWKNAFPDHEILWTGEVARKTPVISSIEGLVTPRFNVSSLDTLPDAELLEETGNESFSIRFNQRFTVRLFQSHTTQRSHDWIRRTAPDPLAGKILKGSVQGDDVSTMLKRSGFDGLPAEMFDYEGIENSERVIWTDLVTQEAIKGIVHNHSTWSDGIHTLEEMALYVREQGFEYFGICDHSQSAFYANGLSPERVLQQMEEIDALNKKLAPFRIIKGIESDILNDGSLDYEPDLLKRFEIVVASVHSNLRMDIDKATARLIRAIENPFTRILGHPTSRLLLARPGYPIHYKKVIDACAANNVVIELNANPQRMDIDHTWLPYCQEKGVKVSINPDAHSRSQVNYIRYGVMTARKGGLKTENCLNALSLNEFLKWMNKK